MAKDNETISLTHQQLNDLVSNAVKAAMDSVSDKNARSTESQMGPDELHAHLKQSLRQPPLPEQRVKCISPDTKATFTAVVSPSRSYPEGRIVKIEDYEHPKGHDVSQANGGLVPNGLPIMNKATGVLSADYKQWRFVTYIQADLRRWIGKQLPPYLRADQTPPAAPVAAT